MNSSKMRELLKQCLKENISGKYTKVTIDGTEYYASFEFREVKKTCDKCGGKLKC